ncbi:hypothetical protein VOLCADRAFT_96781 [Volvox carteri f. nagariensis]|uniref:SPX domain-containing protein n=1 Tax=Volvox carteri f. nagariensis TaxID=3068 RepID=D8UB15_VOLCA|nr:uncharacterized protein VOLCADRAFT_96781 [Volvox carteri f. nagariensis]EFJ43033.1 hypothetical protein VOLCADRAFT_96781 [Volvox carteri f. nagariensis]|eukprot:XP_002955832.1 hypothetical protein VOLCADRAFT_96781 [Volvox carteri f. nagariensis]
MSIQLILAVWHSFGMFGKVLKVSSENMPAEMHDLFLRYKELKKQIKMIPINKDTAAGEKQASVSPEGSATGSGSTGAAITATVLSPEEQAFIATLNEALCDELAAAAAAAGLYLPAALTNAATVLFEHENETTTTIISATTCLRSPYDTALQGGTASGVAAGPSPAATSTQRQLGEAEPARQPRETAPHSDGTAGGTALRDVVDVIPRDAGEPVIRLAGLVASPSDQERQQPGCQPSHPHQHQHQHRSPHRHHHHTHHNTGTSSSSSPHFSALQEVKSRLVQFHGEMVLLLHWSLLNYAAVVKILKKHDKRTGVLLRAPYLANVLQQPFSSTTIMSRLAKRAEELVVATTQLSPVGAGSARLQAAAAAAGGAAVAADTSTALPSADKSSVPSDMSAVQDAHVATAAVGPAAAAAEAAPSGRGTTSASDASTLTIAADREGGGGFGDVSGHSQPLVGSTMHALETWANLKKNAITPSTVLAEVTLQHAADAGGVEASGVLGDQTRKVPRRDNETDRKVEE